MTDNNNEKKTTHFLGVIVGTNNRITLPMPLVKDLEVKEKDTLMFRKEGDTDWRITKLGAENF